ncbi:amidase signature domain-containing protein [Tricladium varicosporioides]|nr:amidase signature domain-containing protein [Hymenoscyphus varicosporioides]
MSRLSAGRAAVAAAKDITSNNVFITKPFQRNGGKQTSFGNARAQPEVELQDSFEMSLAVKDNIATATSPTTCASGILSGYKSPFEAWVVKLAKEAIPISSKTILNKTKARYTVSGKTNMDEFGMGSHSTNSYYGAVSYEYDEAQAVSRSLSSTYQGGRRSVGGSSGGSALAVASGECAVALGTDTGGSVRLPAAYTGTVGFKPSYGILSRRGVVPYANSLDTVGMVGSEVVDVLEMFDRLKEVDDRDPTNLNFKSRLRARKRIKVQLDQRLRKLSQIRIGVPVEYNIAELHPAVRKAWQDALELLQEMGCTIVPISLPNTKHALSAYYILAPAEAASNLAKYDGVRYGNRSMSNDGAGGSLFSQTRGEGFGDEVKRRILLGTYTLCSEAIDNYFIKAQKIRRLVQRDFDRCFILQNPLQPGNQFDLSDMDESVQLQDKLGPPQVDFIVCPTAPTPPPLLQEVLETQNPNRAYMNDVFTVPASLAGLPAITIPFQGRISEHEESGQPPHLAGIQIIGQYYDDAGVLYVAKALQKVQRKLSDTLITEIPFKPRKDKLLQKYASKKGAQTQHDVQARRAGLRKKLTAKGYPVEEIDFVDEVGNVLKKHGTDKAYSMNFTRRLEDVQLELEETFDKWDEIYKLLDNKSSASEGAAGTGTRNLDRGNESIGDKVEYRGLGDLLSEIEKGNHNEKDKK